MYSVLDVFRQRKDLAWVDPVWIPDLAGIGLVDRGILDALTIDTARNGPKIVATADDGLAGGKALRVRTAYSNGDHGGDVGCRLGRPRGGDGLFSSRFGKSGLLGSRCGRDILAWRWFFWRGR